MNKICFLIPCLMTENNRVANKKAIDFNVSHLCPDEVVIYDQAFAESDYDPRYTYIGFQKDRVGFTNARNGLLSWFYNSDYDYAMWLDANESISKPTLNDARTVLDAIKSNGLDNIDVIFSTLGLWVSQDRIIAKKSPEHSERVSLVPAHNDRSYNWMHGLFMKNFKKFYNQPVYIDARCDVKLGTAEDVYFSRIIRRLFNAYVCPTIVISKPDSKTSTHAGNGKGGYVYPPVKFDVVDSYIYESSKSEGFKQYNLQPFRDPISIPRVEYMKEKVTGYKPKSLKPVKEDSEPFSKVELF